MSMTPTDVIAALESRWPGEIAEKTEFRGDWSVAVPREKLVEIARFLRDDCAFAMLTDLSGVDHFGEAVRYEVDYTLYSFTHRFWFRIKVRVPESDAEVDTLTGLWKTADWHEREAFDMYGIRFRNHPNLTRILMWEGYPYHPLRKDFPLAGLPADLPETATGAGSVESAPMLGGPFVSSVGTRSSLRREPRQYDTLAEQADKLSRPPKSEDV